MIDNCLNLQMELQKKKQIERQLITQSRRMAYMKLDQSARYHIWQTLFKSRTWYSIIMTTRISEPMKKWAQSYLYRSIKTLMGISGNPSTDSVYRSTFLETQNDVVNLIWTQSISNRMLKTPVDQRESLANRYNLTNQIPTSTEELVHLTKRPKEMWQRAKLVLTQVNKSVFKWWAATRYQGHTRNFGTIKCTCDNRTTLTQIHIIHCPRFGHCYEQTALEHGISQQTVKHRLAEREEDSDTEYITKINAMEKTLSEKITRVIGTFQGPRAANVAR